MTLSILLLTFILILISFSVTAYDAPSVCSDTTCWHGTWMKSYDDIIFHAYLGVPYALSPTGQNRFQDPIKWKAQQINNKDVNCKIDPPPCLQQDYRNSKEVYGHEDCLFMNIYMMGNYTKDSKVKQFI